MLADMDDTGSWITVAVADERRSAELALVLTARDIDYRRVLGFRGWELCVPAPLAAAATAELAQYLAENKRAVGQRHVEHVGGALPGVAAYLLILLLAFACLHKSVFNLDWLVAGRFDAGRVAGGEWWRVVTALTVHFDIDHLAGNLGFGAFFGYFVGHYLGRGAGWLAILSSAAFANAVAALVEPAGHRSIGASTAVFAAVGILTAYTWRRGYLRDTPWRARIAPIVAGLGLLAFTGTAGENTDLLAHLFGFVAGFGCGLLFARFTRIAALRSRRLQSACAAIAVATLAGAWVWGLLAAG
ncbi:MAG TPA: rhomboid family intramembrane serine protease [Gammaproteobacteria bacterium]|nr:rhomboid family intramembrane serine protease [Gammaproteobacteria bacterium]